MRHARAVVVAAVVAVSIALIASAVLAACGGDDDDTKSVDKAINEAVEKGNIDGSDATTAPAGSVDPCAIVRTADAAALFGVRAHIAEDTSPVALGVTCFYESARADRPGRVDHSLRVRVYDGKEFFGADTVQGERRLSGIGDRAFVRTDTGALGGVEVRFVASGDTVAITYGTVNIGVPVADRVDAASRRDDVVALARRAAGRMP